MKEIDPYHSGSHPVEAVKIARYGRLSVEQRVLGFHSTLWMAAVGLAAGWMLAMLTPEKVSQLDWSALAVPIVCAFVGHMLGLIAAMPKTRWLRGGTLADAPSAVPLMLIGFVAAPFYLLLWFRNERALPRERKQSEDEIDEAFGRLLKLPRVASFGLALTLGLALLVDAILLAADLPLQLSTALGWALLGAAMVAPFLAISFSRTHAILRPEFLSAPRPTTAVLPQRRDLQVRMAVPAATAMIGVIVAPLIATQMFQRAHERELVVAEAQAVAESLLGEVDHSDPEALGRFLAAHPDVTVQRGGVNYGPQRDHMPSQTGPVDDDGDGVPEAVAVVVRQGEVAVVPVAAPVQHGQTAMGIGVLCLLLAGLASVILVARGVRADVLRATRQVRRVARGQIPEPLRADSFNSKELRELVQAVDRLVGRITEANVAKYVVIEKAQEADRLRSQFLANMSHDLRSPLNSVLGFSELLLTGIDGDLETDQAEMVEIIQRSGRFLLQQIDEILDTAKVDAGRMEVHAEPIPAAALISRAVEKARPRVGPEIEFVAESAAGLPPAFADPYRAVQALENILVFATERMEAGRIRVISRLRKGKEGEGRWIEIEVITPAPPATQMQLERVLEGFFRISGHTGLGLGLPLAGSILELHRGSLDIKHEDGSVHFLAAFPVPERRRKLRVTGAHAPLSSSPRLFLTET